VVVFRAGICSLLEGREGGRGAAEVEVDVWNSALAAFLKGHRARRDRQGNGIRKQANG